MTCLPWLIVLVVSGLLLAVYTIVRTPVRDEITMYEAMQEGEPVHICSVDDCGHPGVPLWQLGEVRADIAEMQSDMHFPPDTILCDYHRESALGLWRLIRKQTRGES